MPAALKQQTEQEQGRDAELADATNSYIADAPDGLSKGLVASFPAAQSFSSCSSAGVPGGQLGGAAGMEVTQVPGASIALPAATGAMVIVGSLGSALGAMASGALRRAFEAKEKKSSKD